MDLITIEHHLIDIADVVQKAIDQKKGMIERTWVAMRLKIIPNLPRIPGDEKNLQRAIAAILDNAIKFSPDGGEVFITLLEEPGHILINIQDYGVGIPPEAMPRIFQRFFHMDIVCGRMFRGIGLGLSIAKQVIEQHEGTIEVNSELGRGCTVIIRLAVPA